MLVKCKKEQTVQIKSKIFYSHTYRHLKLNHKEMVLYYLLFAVPIIIIYLCSYEKITYNVSYWVSNIISLFVSKKEIGISSGGFLPWFGGVYFLTLPSKMPSFILIVTNSIVTILLFILCLRIKDSMKPIAIYFTVALLIHLTSCVFFLFMQECFPYTLSQFSELYMKQQVGIWLAFITIATLISGFISYSGISKYIFVFAVIVYSFVFGCLRYIFFLVILSKVSSLYMAVLFFSFGPLFDFLYLVSIYSIYMNRLILKFDDRKNGGKWHWG